MSSWSSMALLLAEQPLSDWWADQFLGLDQEQRFVVVLVIIGCATAAICTIVGCVSGVVSVVQRRRLEADLKREMLDRGMNAEEIARVVEATPPTNFLERQAMRWQRK